MIADESISSLTGPDPLWQRGSYPSGERVHVDWGRPPLWRHLLEVRIFVDRAEANWMVDCPQCAVGVKGASRLRRTSGAVLLQLQLQLQLPSGNPPLAVTAGKCGRTCRGGLSLRHPSG